MISKFRWDKCECIFRYELTLKHISPTSSKSTKLGKGHSGCVLDVIAEKEREEEVLNTNTKNIFRFFKGSSTSGSTPSSLLINSASVGCFAKIAFVCV